MLRHGVLRVMPGRIEGDVERREGRRLGHHRGREQPAGAPHGDVLGAHALLQHGADRALDEQLRRLLALQQAEQLLEDLQPGYSEVSGRERAARGAAVRACSGIPGAQGT